MDVLRRADEQPHQFILEVVRVLIFVYQYVAEAVVIDVTYVRMLLQKLGGQIQQIIEIDGVQPDHFLFIEVRDFRKSVRRSEIFTDGEIVERPSLALCLGNQFVHGPRRDAVWEREIRLFEDFFQNGLLFGRVVDCEIACTARLQKFDIRTEEPCAAGMECAACARFFTDQCRNTAFHFLRGFVRKRHGENLARPDAL